MKIVCALSFMLALIVCCPLCLLSQDGSKWNKISSADFKKPSSPAIDSNSGAIILSSVGVIDFAGNKKGYMDYIFKKRQRILILDKNAFDLATIEVSLYKDDYYEEKLTDIAAVTYNLEGGTVTETKLDKKDIFTNKTSKNYSEQKFTLPGVKEGSIIEYSYTFTSNYLFNIPAWNFQSVEYPCLWSDYQVTIPSLLLYVFSRLGVHPFFIDKADEGHANYYIVQPADRSSTSDQERSFNVGANTVKHRWVLKDIPALYVENYISTPRNYLDRIEFQLKARSYGEEYIPVKDNWAKLTEELLKDKNFASFFTDQEDDYWIERALSTVVKNDSPELQKARDIYYYLTKNFSCTSYYHTYIDKTLQDVYKKRSGNVAEINLLLTAMLVKKGIHAAPVLLSTREFGFNYSNYPIMSRLNYVVCRVVIGDAIYYLDASHTNLGFGNLPANCYNGHARIISNTDSASVYFNADSLKEQKMSFVNIVKSEKDKNTLSGSFQQLLGKLESYETREKIGKEGKAVYFEDIKTSARGELDLTSTGVDSLDKPEYPITVRGEFNLKMDEGNDIIYLNPFLVSAYHKNPFTAAVRKYPVEMPHPIDEVYVLNMEIPDGYMVEEMPKATRVLYNQNEGMFEYIIQKMEGSIQMRCTLRLKKAFFGPEEYESLRSFFGMVVKKQDEQIVFKRKK